MKRSRSQHWMVVLAHAGALIPLAFLGVNLFLGKFEPNPITTLEQTSGRIAISLLVLTLAVSPLAYIVRQPHVSGLRIILGLYTYLYASLHVFILVVLDYGGDLPLLLASYIDKPFIWFGAGTFIILSALALTSLNRLKKWMGSRWKYLHRLIYLAAILAVTHYFLVVKGGLLTFSGNLARPLLYAGIFLILMALRLAVARQEKANPS